MIRSVSSGVSHESYQAIEREFRAMTSELNLRSVGWRGFDKVDWVQDITSRYPRAEEIAHECSSHRPGYLDDVKELFAEALPEHKKDLHRYYIGKLALEELSCQMNGAAAGACDKRAAYLDICHLTRRLQHQ